MRRRVKVFRDLVPRDLSFDITGAEDVELPTFLAPVLRWCFAHCGWAHEASDSDELIRLRFDARGFRRPGYRRWLPVRLGSIAVRRRTRDLCRRTFSA